MIIKWVGAFFLVLSGYLLTTFAGDIIESSLLVGGICSAFIGWELYNG